MSADWFLLVPLMVFSKIKNRFSESVKEELGMKDDNFSTVGSSSGEAIFPFVYFQTLQSAEEGRDLHGTDTNGVLYTFQVDVTDNKSQARARKVMSEVAVIMKNMGFEIVAMPMFESNQDRTHRMTARFRRIIGASDKL